jgi:hypothetical protein
MANLVANTSKGRSLDTLINKKGKAYAGVNENKGDGADINKAAVAASNQADKAPSKPRAKVQKYVKVPVFFKYADGSVCVIKIKDTIARFAGLEPLVGSDMFAKSENGVIQPIKPTPTPQNVELIFGGKALGQSATPRGSLSGRRRRGSADKTTGGKRFKTHSVGVPRNASVFDVLAWLNSWKRTPPSFKPEGKGEFFTDKKAITELKGGADPLKGI